MTTSPPSDDELPPLQAASLSEGLLSSEDFFPMPNFRQTRRSQPPQPSQRPPPPPPSPPSQFPDLPTDLDFLFEENNPTSLTEDELRQTRYDVSFYTPAHLIEWYNREKRINSASAQLITADLLDLVSHMDTSKLQFIQWDDFYRCFPSKARKPCLPPLPHTFFDPQHPYYTRTISNCTQLRVPTITEVKDLSHHLFRAQLTILKMIFPSLPPSTFFPPSQPQFEKDWQHPPTQGDLPAEIQSHAQDLFGKVYQIIHLAHLNLKDELFSGAIEVKYDLRKFLIALDQSPSTTDVEFKLNPITQTQILTKGGNNPIQVLNILHQLEPDIYPSQNDALFQEYIKITRPSVSLQRLTDQANKRSQKRGRENVMIDEGDIFDSDDDVPDATFGSIIPGIDDEIENDWNNEKHDNVIPPITETYPSLTPMLAALLSRVPDYVPIYYLDLLPLGMNHNPLSRFPTYHQFTIEEFFIHLAAAHMTRQLFHCSTCQSFKQSLWKREFSKAYSHFNTLVQLSLHLTVPGSLARLPTTFPSRIPQTSFLPLLIPGNNHLGPQIAPYNIPFLAVASKFTLKGKQSPAAKSPPSSPSSRLVKDFAITCPTIVVTQALSEKVKEAPQLTIPIQLATLAQHPNTALDETAPSPSTLKDSTSRYSHLTDNQVKLAYLLQNCTTWNFSQACFLYQILCLAFPSTPFHRTFLHHIQSPQLKTLNLQLNPQYENFRPWVLLHAGRFLHTLCSTTFYYYCMHRSKFEVRPTATTPTPTTTTTQSFEWDFDQINTLAIATLVLLFSVDPEGSRRCFSMLHPSTAKSTTLAPIIFTAAWAQMIKTIPLQADLLHGFVASSIPTLFSPCQLPPGAMSSISVPVAFIHMLHFYRSNIHQCLTFYQEMYRLITATTTQLLLNESSSSLLSYIIQRETGDEKLVSQSRQQPSPFSPHDRGDKFLLWGIVILAALATNDYFTYRSAQLGLMQNLVISAEWVNPPSHNSSSKPRPDATPHYPEPFAQLFKPTTFPNNIVQPFLIQPFLHRLHDLNATTQLAFKQQQQQQQKQPISNSDSTTSSRIAYIQFAPPQPQQYQATTKYASKEPPPPPPLLLSHAQPQFDAFLKSQPQMQKTQKKQTPLLTNPVISIYDLKIPILSRVSMEELPSMFDEYLDEIKLASFPANPLSFKTPLIITDIHEFIQSCFGGIGDSSNLRDSQLVYLHLLILNWKSAFSEPAIIPQGRLNILKAEAGLDTGSTKTNKTPLPPAVLAKKGNNNNRGAGKDKDGRDNKGNATNKNDSKAHFPPINQEQLSTAHAVYQKYSTLLPFAAKKLKTQAKSLAQQYSGITSFFGFNGANLDFTMRYCIDHVSKSKPSWMGKWPTTHAQSTLQKINLDDVPQIAHSLAIKPNVKDVNDAKEVVFNHLPIHQQFNFPTQYLSEQDVKSFAQIQYTTLHNSNVIPFARTDSDLANLNLLLQTFPTLPFWSADQVLVSVLLTELPPPTTSPAAQLVLRNLTNPHILHYPTLLRQTFLDRLHPTEYFSTRAILLLHALPTEMDETDTGGPVDDDTDEHNQSLSVSEPDWHTQVAPNVIDLIVKRLDEYLPRHHGHLADLFQFAQLPLLERFRLLLSDDVKVLVWDRRNIQHDDDDDNGGAESNTENPTDLAEPTSFIQPQKMTFGELRQLHRSREQPFFNKPHAHDENLTSDVDSTPNEIKIERQAGLEALSGQSGQLEECGVKFETSSRCSSTRTIHQQPTARELLTVCSQDNTVMTPFGPVDLAASLVFCSVTDLAFVVNEPFEVNFVKEIKQRQLQRISDRIRNPHSALLIDVSRSGPTPDSEKIDLLTFGLQTLDSAPTLVTPQLSQGYTEIDRFFTVAARIPGLDWSTFEQDKISWGYPIGTVYLNNIQLGIALNLSPGLAAAQHNTLVSLASESPLPHRNLSSILPLYVTNSIYNSNTNKHNNKHNNNNNNNTKNTVSTINNANETNFNDNNISNDTNTTTTPGSFRAISNQSLEFFFSLLQCDPEDPLVECVKTYAKVLNTWCEDALHSIATIEQETQSQIAINPSIATSLVKIDSICFAPRAPIYNSKFTPDQFFLARLDTEIADVSLTEPAIETSSTNDKAPTTIMSKELKSVQTVSTAQVDSAYDTFSQTVTAYLNTCDHTTLYRRTSRVQYSSDDDLKCLNYLLGLHSVASEFHPLQSSSSMIFGQKVAATISIPAVNVISPLSTTTTTTTSSSPNPRNSPITMTTTPPTSSCSAFTFTSLQLEKMTDSQLFTLPPLVQRFIQINYALFPDQLSSFKPFDGHISPNHNDNNTLSYATNPVYHQQSNNVPVTNPWATVCEAFSAHLAIVQQKDIMKQFFNRVLLTPRDINTLKELTVFDAFFSNTTRPTVETLSTSFISQQPISLYYPIDQWALLDAKRTLEPHLTSISTFLQPQWYPQSEQQCAELELILHTLPVEFSLPGATLTMFNLMLLKQFPPNIVFTALSLANPEAMFGVYEFDFQHFVLETIAACTTLIDETQRAELLSMVSAEVFQQKSIDIKSEMASTMALLFSYSALYPSTAILHLFQHLVETWFADIPKRVQQCSDTISQAIETTNQQFFAKSAKETEREAIESKKQEELKAKELAKEQKEKEKEEKVRAAEQQKQQREAQAQREKEQQLTQKQAREAAAQAQKQHAPKNLFSKLKQLSAKQESMLGKHLDQAGDDDDDNETTADGRNSKSLTCVNDNKDLSKDSDGFNADELPTTHDNEEKEKKQNKVNGVTAPKVEKTQLKINDVAEKPSNAPASLPHLCPVPTTLSPAPNQLVDPPAIQQRQLVGILHKQTHVNAIDNRDDLVQFHIDHQCVGIGTGIRNGSKQDDNSHQSSLSIFPRQSTAPCCITSTINSLGLSQHNQPPPQPFPLVPLPQMQSLSTVYPSERPCKPQSLIDALSIPFPVLSLPITSDTCKQIVFACGDQYSLVSDWKTNHRFMSCFKYILCLQPADFQSVFNFIHQSLTTPRQQYNPTTGQLLHTIQQSLPNACAIIQAGSTNLHILSTPSSDPTAQMLAFCYSPLHRPHTNLQYLLGFTIAFTQLLTLLDPTNFTTITNYIRQVAIANQYPLIFSAYCSKCYYFPATHFYKSFIRQQVTDALSLQLEITKATHVDALARIQTNSQGNAEVSQSFVLDSLNGVRPILQHSVFADSFLTPSPLIANTPQPPSRNNSPPQLFDSFFHHCLTHQKSPFFAYSSQPLPHPSIQFISTPNQLLPAKLHTDLFTTLAQLGTQLNQLQHTISSMSNLFQHGFDASAKVMTLQKEWSALVHKSETASTTTTTSSSSNNPSLTDPERKRLISMKTLVQEAQSNLDTAVSSLLTAVAQYCAVQHQWAAFDENTVTKLHVCLIELLLLSTHIPFNQKLLDIIFHLTFLPYLADRNVSLPESPLNNFPHIVIQNVPISDSLQHPNYPTGALPPQNTTAIALRAADFYQIPRHASTTHFLSHYIHSPASTVSVLTTLLNPCHPSHHLRLPTRMLHLILNELSQTTPMIFLSAFTQRLNGMLFNINEDSMTFLPYLYFFSSLLVHFDDFTFHSYAPLAFFDGDELGLAVVDAQTTLPQLSPRVKRWQEIAASGGASSSFTVSMTNLLTQSLPLFTLAISMSSTLFKAPKQNILHPKLSTTKSSSFELSSSSPNTTHTQQQRGQLQLPDSAHTIPQFNISPVICPSNLTLDGTQVDGVGFLPYDPYPHLHLLGFYSAISAVSSVLLLALSKHMQSPTHKFSQVLIFIDLMQLGAKYGSIETKFAILSTLTYLPPFSLDQLRSVHPASTTHLPVLTTQHQPAIIDFAVDTQDRRGALFLQSSASTTPTTPTTPTQKNQQNRQTQQTRRKQPTYQISVPQADTIFAETNQNIFILYIAAEILPSLLTLDQSSTVQFLQILAPYTLALLRFFQQIAPSFPIANVIAQSIMNTLLTTWVFPLKANQIIPNTNMINAGVDVALNLMRFGCSQDAIKCTMLVYTHLFEQTCDQLSSPPSATQLAPSDSHSKSPDPSPAPQPPSPSLTTVHAISRILSECSAFLRFEVNNPKFTTTTNSKNPALSPSTLQQPTASSPDSTPLSLFHGQACDSFAGYFTPELTSGPQYQSLGLTTLLLLATTPYNRQRNDSEFDTSQTTDFSMNPVQSAALEQYTQLVFGIRFDLTERTDLNVQVPKNAPKQPQPEKAEQSQPRPAPESEPATPTTAGKKNKKRQGQHVQQQPPQSTKPPTPTRSTGCLSFKPCRSDSNGVPQLQNVSISTIHFVLRSAFLTIRHFTQTYEPSNSVEAHRRFLQLQAAIHIITAYLGHIRIFFPEPTEYILSNLLFKEPPSQPPSAALNAPSQGNSAPSSLPPLPEGNFFDIFHQIFSTAIQTMLAKLTSMKPVSIGKKDGHSHQLYVSNLSSSLSLLESLLQTYGYFYAQIDTMHSTAHPIIDITQFQPLLTKLNDTVFADHPIHFPDSTDAQRGHELYYFILPSLIYSFMNRIGIVAMVTIGTEFYAGLYQNRTLTPQMAQSAVKEANLAGRPYNLPSANTVGQFPQLSTTFVQHLTAAFSIANCYHDISLQCTKLLPSTTSTNDSQISLFVRQHVESVIAESTLIYSLLHSTLQGQIILCPHQQFSSRNDILTAANNATTTTPNPTQAKTKTHQLTLIPEMMLTTFLDPNPVASSAFTLLDLGLDYTAAISADSDSNSKKNYSPGYQYYLEFTRNYVIFNTTHTTAQVSAIASGLKVSDRTRKAALRIIISTILDIIVRSEHQTIRLQELMDFLIRFTFSAPQNSPTLVTLFAKLLQAAISKHDAVQIDQFTKAPHIYRLFDMSFAIVTHISIFAIYGNKHDIQLPYNLLTKPPGSLFSTVLTSNSSSDVQQISISVILPQSHSKTQPTATDCIEVHSQHIIKDKFDPTTPLSVVARRVESALGSIFDDSDTKPSSRQLFCVASRSPFQLEMTVEQALRVQVYHATNHQQLPPRIQPPPADQASTNPSRPTQPTQQANSAQQSHKSNKKAKGTAQSTQSTTLTTPSSAAIPSSSTVNSSQQSSKDRVLELFILDTPDASSSGFKSFDLYDDIMHTFSSPKYLSDTLPLYHNSNLSATTSPHSPLSLLLPHAHYSSLIPYDTPLSYANTTFLSNQADLCWLLGCQNVTSTSPPQSSSTTTTQPVRQCTCSGLVKYQNLHYRDAAVRSMLARFQSNQQSQSYSFLNSDEVLLNNTGTYNDPYTTFIFYLSQDKELNQAMWSTLRPITGHDFRQYGQSIFHAAQNGPPSPIFPHPTTTALSNLIQVLPPSFYLIDTLLLSPNTNPSFTQPKSAIPSILSPNFSPHPTIHSPLPILYQLQLIQSILVTYADHKKLTNSINSTPQIQPQTRTKTKTCSPLLSSRELFLSHIFANNFFLTLLRLFQNHAVNTVSHTTPIGAMAYYLDFSHPFSITTTHSHHRTYEYIQLSLKLQSCMAKLITLLPTVSLLSFAHSSLLLSSENKLVPTVFSPTNLLAATSQRTPTSTTPLEDLNDLSPLHQFILLAPSSSPDSIQNLYNTAESAYYSAVKSTFVLDYSKTLSKLAESSFDERSFKNSFANFTNSIIISLFVSAALAYLSPIHTHANAAISASLYAVLQLFLTRQNEYSSAPAIDFLKTHASQPLVSSQYNGSINTCAQNWLHSTFPASTAAEHATSGFIDHEILSALPIPQSVHNVFIFALKPTDFNHHEESTRHLISSSDSITTCGRTPLILPATLHTSITSAVLFSISHFAIFSKHSSPRHISTTSSAFGQCVLLNLLNPHDETARAITFGSMQYMIASFELLFSINTFSTQTQTIKTAHETPFSTSLFKDRFKSSPFAQKDLHQSLYQSLLVTNSSLLNSVYDDKLVQTLHFPYVHPASNTYALAMGSSDVHYTYQFTTPPTESHPGAKMQRYSGSILDSSWLQCCYPYDYHNLHSPQSDSVPPPLTIISSILLAALPAVLQWTCPLTSFNIFQITQDTPCIDFSGSPITPTRLKSLIDQHNGQMAAELVKQDFEASRLHFPRFPFQLHRVLRIDSTAQQSRYNYGQTPPQPPPTTSNIKQFFDLFRYCLAIAMPTFTPIFYSLEQYSRARTYHILHNAGRDDFKVGLQDVFSPVPHELFTILSVYFQELIFSDTQPLGARVMIELIGLLTTLIQTQPHIRVLAIASHLHAMILRRFVAPIYGSSQLFESSGTYGTAVNNGMLGGDIRSLIRGPLHPPYHLSLVLPFALLLTPTVPIPSLLQRYRQHYHLPTITAHYSLVNLPHFTFDDQGVLEFRSEGDSKWITSHMQQHNDVCSVLLGSLAYSPPSLPSLPYDFQKHTTHKPLLSTPGVSTFVNSNHCTLTSLIHQHISTNHVCGDDKADADMFRRFTSIDKNWVQKEKLEHQFDLSNPLSEQDRAHLWFLHRQHPILTDNIRKPIELSPNSELFSSTLSWSDYHSSENLQFIQTACNSLSKGVQPSNRNLPSAAELNTLSYHRYMGYYSFDPSPSLFNSNDPTYQPLFASANTLTLPPQPVGLYNLTNTCYLNTVLQQLFTSPSFVQIIMSFDAETILKEKIRVSSQLTSVPPVIESLLIYNLQRLAIALWLSPFKTHFTSTDILQFVTDPFGEPASTSIQLDANEVLLQLFSRLNDEITLASPATSQSTPNTHSMGRGSAKSDKNQNASQFRLQINNTANSKPTNGRTRLQNAYVTPISNHLDPYDCPHARLRYENSEWTISLAISDEHAQDQHEHNCTHIDASLDLFRKPHDNIVTCEQCPRRPKRITERRTTFNALPETLTMYIQRFKHISGGSYAKDNSRVAFDQLFDGSILSQDNPNPRQLHNARIASIVGARSGRSGEFYAHFMSTNGRNKNTFCATPPTSLSNPDDCKYILSNIAVHSGTAYSGHYMSFISNQNSFYQLSLGLAMTSGVTERQSSSHQALRDQHNNNKTTTLLDLNLKDHSAPDTNPYWYECNDAVVTLMTPSSVFEPAVDTASSKSTQKSGSDKKPRQPQSQSQTSKLHYHTASEPCVECFDSFKDQVFGQTASRQSAVLLTYQRLSKTSSSQLQPLTLPSYLMSTKKSFDISTGQSCRLLATLSQEFYAYLTTLQDSISNARVTKLFPLLAHAITSSSISFTIFVQSRSIVWNYGDQLQKIIAAHIEHIDYHTLQSLRTTRSTDTLKLIESFWDWVDLPFAQFVPSSFAAVVLNNIIQFHPKHGQFSKSDALYSLPQLIKSLRQLVCGHQKWTTPPSRHCF